MFHRATALFLILALLAGSALSFMPMATAMPVANALGNVLPGDHDGCKGCTPAKMAVADCGAICISPVAIVQPVAALLAGTSHPLWPWSDESFRRDGTEPPTAPPR